VTGPGVRVKYTTGRSGVKPSHIYIYIYTYINTYIHIGVYVSMHLCFNLSIHKYVAILQDGRDRACETKRKAGGQP